MKNSVVAIIVTFNSIGDISRCLASFKDIACPVLVIDNLSIDGTPDVIERDFPWVGLKRMSSNVGFAKACNLGMSEFPDAEYFLIINPDTCVTNVAVQELVDFAEAHEDVGIVVPKILNDDLTLQESCRTVQTPLLIALRRTPIGRMRFAQSVMGTHLLRNVNFDGQSIDVDWAIGAAMLIRRKALICVGGFDERFFLYFEDLDLCYRMWQSQWRVVCDSKSEIIHSHKRESAKRQWRISKTTRLHLSSAFAFFTKYPNLIIGRTPNFLPSSNKNSSAATLKTSIDACQGD